MSFVYEAITAALLLAQSIIGSYEAPVAAQSIPETPVPLAVEAHVLSAEQVYGIALDASGSEAFAAFARAVSVCESGRRVGAVGRAGEVGLLQVHPVHFARFAHLDLYSARGNLRAGYVIWRESGAQPWSCAR